MLTQSLTWHLIGAAIAALKRLGGALIQGFKESRLINKIYSVVFFLSESAKESKIIANSKKDIFTAKYYESSVFYRLLNNVFGLMLKITGKIETIYKKAAEGSVTEYVTGKIACSEQWSLNNMLALFIGLMFIAPHEIWNNLYGFLGAVIFGVWVIIDMAGGRLSAGDIRGISVSIIGFLAAMAVSIFTAIHVSDAFRIGILMATSVILAFAVYAALDTKEKLMRFLKTVLAAVTLTAVFGIAQRFMGIEVDPEYVDTITNAGMPGRVFSTFANPNNFAELLLLFIPFFVPLFLWEKRKFAKWIVFAAFCGVLTALAMTYSRSCWVGLALAAVIFVMLYDIRLIVPLGIVVFIAIPLLPDAIMNRIFTIGSMKDTSNSYRIYIWESCLRMVRDFGGTGLGLGPATFKAVYPSYADPAAITAPHSHMLYMELVLEMGLLGFLSFAGFIYFVVKKTINAISTKDYVLKAVMVSGLSAAAGIAFVCCAEYVWFYPRVMFACWIVPGVLLAAARIAKKQ